MSINIGPVGYGTYYYELNDSDHVLHLDNRKDVIYRSGVQVRISRFNWRINFLLILFRKGMHLDWFLNYFVFEGMQGLN